MAYFLGIDVGTQGARVILVDHEGGIVDSRSKKFVINNSFREEQSPELWWEYCYQLIDEIVLNLPDGFNRESIIAASVTSTSGTVIPLDANMNPLHNAIMYSDLRSAEQGLRIKKIACKYVSQGYTGFNASSGISKILWFQESFPEKKQDIHLWVHASDFIVGKLCGNYGTTDYTNVLKSGYDLDKLEWPDYIFDEFGFQRGWMQEVVPSGTVVGSLSCDLSERWSIPQIDVVVGITDGCSSQIASGAVNPGDWNTTIGTTLVIKGVTRNKVVDDLGRLYSHRHPEGYWMPGGASNTGADWITLDFIEQLDQLTAEAESLIPTGKVAWPLKQSGERFPILAPEATEIVPVTENRAELFAANLEGVAFVERLAYEIIEDLSLEKLTAVYTAGGGSNSDLWLRIRSSVLNVPIYKCKEASGALGAAIMAASHTYYDSLSAAAMKMTSIEREVLPDESLVNSYELQYALFKKKLIELNYL